MLDRTPDDDAVTVRGGHEAVGLDRELGHHGEGIGALDDEVARNPGDVPPTEGMFAQDVGLRERVPGAEHRVLHERGAGS